MKIRDAPSELEPRARVSIRVVTRCSRRLSLDSSFGSLAVTHRRGIAANDPKTSRNALPSGKFHDYWRACAFALRMAPRMAKWSGYIAVALILLAASFPLFYRMSAHRRAAPESPTVRLHVVLGLATAFVAFVHTIVALPSLGSPGAVGGGLLPLASAGCAFFLLVAHAGIGLQLRDIRLQGRARKRRTHAATAIAIVVAVTAHVAGLLSASAR